MANLAKSACPRCALTDDERRRDHKTRHARDCEFARGARSRAKVKQSMENALVRTRETGARITAQVRGGLMAVYDLMGGDKAFLEWARENPGRFYELWAKAAPRESEALNRAAGAKVLILTTSDLREMWQGRDVIDVTPERLQ